MLVENVIIGHVLRSLIICQRTYCTLIIKKIESYLAGTYLIYHCEEKELHVQIKWVELLYCANAPQS